MKPGVWDGLQAGSIVLGIVRVFLDTQNKLAASSSFF